MRINVYKKYSDKPVRVRKWVRNILEAISFCEWYKNTYGVPVNYVICK